MIKLPSLAQVANESPKQLDDQPNSDGIVENKSLSRAIRHLRKMSDDELRALISADDDFVLDCLIDQTPLVSISSTKFFSTDSALARHIH